MAIKSNVPTTTVTTDLKTPQFPAYKIGIPGPLPLKKKKRISLVNNPNAVPKFFIP